MLSIGSMRMNWINVKKIIYDINKNCFLETSASWKKKKQNERIAKKKRIALQASTWSIWILQVNIKHITL